MKIRAVWYEHSLLQVRRHNLIVCFSCPSLVQLFELSKSLKEFSMSVVVQEIQILDRGFDGFAVAIGNIEKLEFGFCQQVVSVHICIIL